MMAAVPSVLPLSTITTSSTPSMIDRTADRRNSSSFLTRIIAEIRLLPATVMATRTAVCHTAAARADGRGPARSSAPAMLVGLRHRPHALGGQSTRVVRRLAELTLETQHSANELVADLLDAVSVSRGRTQRHREQL